MSVFLCFCAVLILLLIQLCISWCTYYIMYNIKIIYIYKIRCSQENGSGHIIIRTYYDILLNVYLYANY